MVNAVAVGLNLRRLCLGRIPHGALWLMQMGAVAELAMAQMCLQVRHVVCELIHRDVVHTKLLKTGGVNNGAGRLVFRVKPVQRGVRRGVLAAVQRTRNFLRS